MKLSPSVSLLLYPSLSVSSQSCASRRAWRPSQRPVKHLIKSFTVVAPKLSVSVPHVLKGGMCMSNRNHRAFCAPPSHHEHAIIRSKGIMSVIMMYWFVHYHSSVRGEREGETTRAESGSEATCWWVREEGIGGELWKGRWGERVTKVGNGKSDEC